MSHVDLQRLLELDQVVTMETEALRHRLRDLHEGEGDPFDQGAELFIGLIMAGIRA